MASNMVNRRNILLTGGGTGGHLSIVRAVREELSKRGAEPFYIGSRSGQDRAWFANDTAFKKRLFLKSVGVVDKKGFSKAASIIQLLKSAKEAYSFMKINDIEAVFSVGGYSAAPASFAAIVSRTPLFVHEQNAVSGTLNRVLKPFAKRFISPYGKGAVDYPVESSFFETARIRTKIGSVIFLGGSQGAKSINDFALSVAAELKRRGIAIIHQTGNSDYKRVISEYRRLGIEADVFGFDKELYKKIAVSDFAVSRGGAGTLWELAANRIPTLFIPYPYAAGDHQYKNSLFFEKRSAGWVLREKALRPELFWKILEENIERVSRNLVSLIAPGGAGYIADILIGEQLFSDLS